MRLEINSVFLCGLLLPIAAQAEAPTNVQVEISFLLGYVEGSGCEFYRNGTWHNSKDAQVHLRDKYKWLNTRNQINNTEDFVEKVATKSSISGQAYSVMCNGVVAQTSNVWLRAELARLRAL